VEAAVVKEAEERRRVERAEAAEEGAVGGEAAVGDAGGGGADEVGWLRQAEEDLRQDVVGQRRHRMRRGHSGIGGLGSRAATVESMGGCSVGPRSRRYLSVGGRSNIVNGPSLGSTCGKKSTGYLANV
jgi:hypothetical protein